MFISTVAKFIGGWMAIRFTVLMVTDPTKTFDMDNENLYVNAIGAMALVYIVLNYFLIPIITYASKAIMFSLLLIVTWVMIIKGFVCLTQMLTTQVVLSRVLSPKIAAECFSNTSGLQTMTLRAAPAFNGVMRLMYHTSRAVVAGHFDEETLVIDFRDAFSFHMQLHRMGRALINSSLCAGDYYTHHISYGLRPMMEPIFELIDQSLDQVIPRTLAKVICWFDIILRELAVTYNIPSPSNVNKTTTSSST
jgi:hypothetical protein